ncbi:hypothetical protein F4777DRAFT_570900 [Nemania sp. FL0916]|nr:hypothetical protein F4777DRAFT_570900 [Nemania sp. FL0916]
MLNTTSLPTPVAEHLPLPVQTDQSNFTWGLVTLVVIIATTYYSFAGSSTLKDVDGNRIPHGPVGVPILGSFPFLTHYPELTLDKWARSFGDLYSVWLGNQLFMIISSPEIAKDLIPRPMEA